MQITTSTTSLGKTKTTCGKHREPVKAQRRSSTNNVISIGWADMPLQGDYVLDVTTAIDAATLPFVSTKQTFAKTSLSNLLLQRSTPPLRLKHSRMASPNTAIGWSDLPCQGDYVMDFSWAVSTRNIVPSSSLPCSTSKALNKQQAAESASPLQLRPMRRKTFKTFSWADMPCQGDYVMDVEMITTTATNTSPVNETDSPARPEINKSTQKQVRFSEFLQIRTYEIVLGSHPLCVEGMALELGWKHYGTEMVAMSKRRQNRPRTMLEFHLPFEVRRDRLLEVTGLTGAELIQLEHSRWMKDQCPNVDDTALNFTVSPCA